MLSCLPKKVIFVLRPNSYDLFFIFAFYVQRKCDKFLQHQNISVIFPGHQLSFAIPLVKIGEIFEEGNRVTQTEREMEH